MTDETLQTREGPVDLTISGSSPRPYRAPAEGAEDPRDLPERDYRAVLPEGSYEEPIEDPAARIFEGCPDCGNAASARLAPDWVRLVNEERANIPIVGCGSPWHYFQERPRMSEPPAIRPDPTAGTCSECHEVRHDWDCSRAGDGRPIEQHPVYRSLRLGAKLDSFEFPASVAAMGGTLARQDITATISEAEAERIQWAVEHREWIPAKRGWFVIASWGVERRVEFAAQEVIVKVSLRGALDRPAGAGGKR